MSGKVVRFVSLTKDQYNDLDETYKTEDTLFFCSETNEIYKGQVLYGRPTNKPLHIGNNLSYDGTEEVSIDGYLGDYILAEIDESGNKTTVTAIIE